MIMIIEEHFEFFKCIYFDEKEKVTENFHKIFNKLSHSSEKNN